MFKHNNDYYTKIGSRPITRIIGKTHIPGKQPMKFKLGKDPQTAFAGELKIQAQWDQLKAKGEKWWDRESLDKIADMGFCSRKYVMKVMAHNAIKLKDEIQEKSSYLKLRPQDVKTAGEFGDWLQVSLTRQLRSEKFLTNFKKAVDTMAVTDPIGAARLYMDFYLRIKGTPSNNNLATSQQVQLNVFKSDDETERKVVVNQANPVDETGDSHLITPTEPTDNQE